MNLKITSDKLQTALQQPVVEEEVSALIETMRGAGSTLQNLARQAVETQERVSKTSFFAYGFAGLSVCTVLFFHYILAERKEI